MLLVNRVRVRQQLLHNLLHKRIRTTTKQRDHEVLWQLGKQSFRGQVEVEKDGGNINMIVCSTCREFSKLTEKPSETEMKNNPFLYGSSSYRKTSFKRTCKKCDAHKFRGAQKE